MQAGTESFCFVAPEKTWTTCQPQAQPNCVGIAVDIAIFFRVSIANNPAANTA